MGETVLIVDDDVDVGLALAAGLEREGRDIVLCRDAESAEIVISARNIAFIVADVRLSGPFRYDGLELLEYARRHAPGAGVIAISGSGAAGLDQAVRERGATFLEKPFDIDTLELLITPRIDSRTESSLTIVPTLDEILSAAAIVPSFQPIVSLGAQHAIKGFEALARVPSAPIVESPLALFRYAERKGRLLDVGLACVRRAIELGASLPETADLFINVDARLFNDASLWNVVADISRSSGVALRRLVLELTEQYPFEASESSLSQVARMREHGIRFAFDDVGVAYAHLPLIGQIRPAYLKISQQFGTGFESDPVLVKIVRNILGLAADFDCAVILEGIESAETAASAFSWGIEFGQGYLFGRPAPAEAAALTRP